MGPNWSATDIPTELPGLPAAMPDFMQPPPQAPAAPSVPQTQTAAPRMPAARESSSPSAARAKAGLSLVMVAAGTGLGAFLGGAPGAGAGFLVTGSLRNLYRAHAGMGDDSGESAKSLTLGVLGLAAGGYLIYRCFAAKKKSKKDDE
jgi:uncharacterized protein HemX